MAHEVYVLLGMVICGAALGALFDLKRGINKSIKPPDFIVGAGDFIFWIIAAAAAAWCAWRLNNGIARFYELAGLIGGAVLYFLMLSRFVLRFFELISEGILKIIVFIFKILLTPVRFLYKIIYNIRTKRSEGDKGNE